MCACTCVRVLLLLLCVYICARARTAFTRTPPRNAKYRPVKAIPARRLNRPTNPLVDTQPPPADPTFYPTLLYFSSPSPLSFTFFLSWDGRDVRRECIEDSVSIFVLATKYFRHRHYLLELHIGWEVDIEHTLAVPIFSIETK